MTAARGPCEKISTSFPGPFPPRPQAREKALGTRLVSEGRVFLQLTTISAGFSFPPIASRDLTALICYVFVFFCLFVCFIFRDETSLFLFNLIFKNLILHIFLLIMIIISYSGMFQDILCFFYRRPLEFAVMSFCGCC